MPYQVCEGQKISTPAGILNAGEFVTDDELSLHAMDETVGWYVKNGFLKKVKYVEVAEDDNDDASDEDDDEGEEEIPATPKKKAGRPKKVAPPPADDETEDEELEEA